MPLDTLLSKQFAGKRRKKICQNVLASKKDIGKNMWVLNAKGLKTPIIRKG
jgi:hypothetical protein